MINCHCAARARPSCFIFLNNYEPARVHVFGDGEAKIKLLGPEGVPELVSAVGMTRADLRRAMRIVNEEQVALLDRWSEIHG